MSEQHCLGIDFGTDSVRVIVIRTDNGNQVAVGTSNYSRWSKGYFSNPTENKFRQHPLDYLESLEEACKKAVNQLTAITRKSIIGIGIDTTGSTVCPVDRTGTPLSLKNEFSENPNAMFILWKDHTSLTEANEINHLARNWGGEDYTRFEGGIYSSEWFWAKILHTIRSDTRVSEAAYSWVEHCDWIPGLLVGKTNPAELLRGRTAAGHKAMWHESWDGLPSEEFFRLLDQKLPELKSRLYQTTYTSDKPAGKLTKEWAAKLNLPANITVAVGSFDAHMGAVGGGIKEGTLVKILGTSTCDMIIANKEKIADRVIQGICGQVDGSIIPGKIGMEAGQSAYGDVYAWFKQILSWPLNHFSASKKTEIEKVLLDELANEAENLPVTSNGIISLDWFNGRRSPNADGNLKAAIANLNLGVTAPMVFRSLVEATAFGSRLIIEHLKENGITIEEIIALGGISQKSDFAVQVATDVLNMPIKVAATSEGSALGAAMFAAVAAGVYSTIEDAQTYMTPTFKKTYQPNPDTTTIYSDSYYRYCELAKTVESGNW